MVIVVFGKVRRYTVFDYGCVYLNIVRSGGGRRMGTTAASSGGPFAVWTLMRLMFGRWI